jgi:hypothetical protein
VLDGSLAQPFNDRTGADSVLDSSFARLLNEKPFIEFLRYIIKAHVPSIVDRLASTLHNSNL